MSDEVNAIDPDTPLFDAFTPPTYDEWYEATVKSLKGKPFEKLKKHTYENIELQPLYRAEDAADLAHQYTLPGDYPYVRGVDATGYLRQPWYIAQQIAYGTPQAFNAALRADLERGQTAINLVLDVPTRNGIDPDQAQADTVGWSGLSLATTSDMQSAFNGVDLSSLPVYAQCGSAGVQLFALLHAHHDGAINGALNVDPLGVLALNGTLPCSIGQAYDEMAALVAWALENAPNLRVIGVDSGPYHEAGADAVQELAYVLATGVTYVRALVERGHEIDAIAAQMQFTFSIGGNFFLEIAKLRAARMLWAQIVVAFGGGDEAQKMHQHARTASYNKTRNDPYVNLLRTTTEAFSGALGGVGSMHIAPFDDAIRPPDEFSRRIARNQQLILQDEANLTRLIDPAGGSWYVEYLTEQLARRAWAVFQQVEGQGGMLAALMAETPQMAIASTGASREENFASRKDVLVGANMYPNLSEDPLVDSTDYDAVYQERLAALREHRSHKRDSVPHTSTLDKLAHLVQAPSAKLIDAAIEAAKAGATLGDLTQVLRHLDNVNQPTVSPMSVHRIARLFEALRHNAAASVVKNGTAPRIFMANIGPLSQYKPRADFARGFFEVGGFDLLDVGGFATGDEAAQAALGADAPAVVICPTDDAYVESVQPLVQIVKSAQPETVIILAGYPQDKVEEYKAVGVDLFIHLKADCYAINRELQESLGVWVD